MTSPTPASRSWTGSLVLIAVVLAVGIALAVWKRTANLSAAAASANPAEPVEMVTFATAVPREFRSSTTAIGTVLALRSITLRNELAGTVVTAALVPGQIVEAGAILVALDVSVEEADLQAQEAQATLATTMLQRLERLREDRATSQEDVDRARAQRDVAIAQIARTRAVIAKKMVRAPFRARVGISDVHPGQYLSEGVELTTLQGLADESHVDFAVAQSVAASLRQGSVVNVVTTDGAPSVPARIVAIDSRVDPTTRNATVRARMRNNALTQAPGGSVRVLVPVGEIGHAVAIPVNALRKGPGGDHVWLVTPDSAGQRRAHETRVTTGPVLGDTVVIISGLTPGATIAASGSFKLREGVRVEARAAEPAPAEHP